MNVITKLEIGKRNKERVNVYIDGEFAFSLHAEIIYKESLKVNDKVDIERLKKMAEEDNYLKCKNSAIRIIERSYKSEKEIREKLLLKEYENKTIDRTLEFLKEYNLLNDEKLTSMYVKDRLRSEGKNKIKYSLIRKGISEDLIEEELSKVDDDNLRETAYNLGLKKYNTLLKRENDKYKLSQKLYRFLMSKGYGYDLISEVVKEIMKTE